MTPVSPMAGQEFYKIPCSTTSSGAAFVLATTAAAHATAAALSPSELQELVR